LMVDLLLLLLMFRTHVVNTDRPSHTRQKLRKLVFRSGKIYQKK
jgi:hypothetical protein